MGTTYRGYRVTSGLNFGVQTLETLNILEGFPLGRAEGWGHNSARTLHHIIEAVELALGEDFI